MSFNDEPDIYHSDEEVVDDVTRLRMELGMVCRKHVFDSFHDQSGAAPPAAEQEPEQRPKNNILLNITRPKSPSTRRKYFDKPGTCIHCGENHFSELCPYDYDKKDPDSLRCFRCGELGHFAADCHNPPRGMHHRRDSPAPAENVKCFKCNEFGHIAARCPKSIESRLSRQKVDHSLPLSKTTCFKCGKTGHFARDCVTSRNKFPSRSFANTQKCSKPHPHGNGIRKSTSPRNRKM